jgi:hypothetical protein
MELILYVTYIVLSIAILICLSYQIFKSISLNNRTYVVHKQLSKENDKTITFEEFIANWNIIKHEKLMLKIFKEDNGKTSIRSYKDGVLYFNETSVMFQGKFYRFNFIEYYKYYDWFMERRYLINIDFWL